MRGGVALALALCVAPKAAHAGRSFFGWLEGSEVMPERSVELQTWVSEENVYESMMNRSISTWGVGPVIGISDQLELALPVEIWWQRVPGMPGATQLNNYGAELRYRLVSPDPVDAPPFVPLVRVSVRRIVRDREVMHPEVGIVSTYETGRVLVAADVGLASDLTRDSSDFELRPAVGVSVLAAGDVRFGAEGIGEVPLDDTGSAWFAVGPNLSWTHGRFWLSAAYTIGVKGVKNTPRMQWGIAF